MKATSSLPFRKSNQMEEEIRIWSLCQSYSPNRHLPNPETISLLQSEVIHWTWQHQARKKILEWFLGQVVPGSYWTHPQVLHTGKGLMNYGQKSPSGLSSWLALQIVTKPRVFCLPHDYANHQEDEFAERKDLITRQPREETGESISDAPRK